MDLFNYKYAIVCKSVPNSVKNGLSLDSDHDEVNVENATIEHNDYLKFLKDAGLKLVEVDGDENYPDCVFVEDTAVVIGKKIFITNMQAPTRHGETHAIKNVVNKFVKENPNENFQVGTISNLTEAFVDGGDCCYTGRELLVGISKRTTQKGAEELAAFFNDIPVTTIDVTDGLHLKSALTMVYFDTIVISKTSAGESMHKQIEIKSKFKEFYKFIEVAADPCANVLFFNNRLAYPSKYRQFYETCDELKHVNKFALENNEFKKIDGCLTCRCIFI